MKRDGVLCVSNCNKRLIVYSNIVATGDGETSTIMELLRSIIIGIVAAVFLAVILSAASGAESAKSQPERKTFKQIIEDHQLGDLATLVERSRPEVRGEEATQSFYDLLKLRDNPDPQAVDVLIEVMEVNAGTSRIHYYAAAQALFTADTPKARKALKKHLLSERKLGSEGLFRYASCWEISEPERSQFIETYILVDQDHDLAVSAVVDMGEASTAADGATEIPVTVNVQIRNVTDQPLQLRDRQVYQGKMLYLRTEAGFATRMRGYVEYDMPMPKWTLLQPGETKAYEIRGTFRTLASDEQPSDAGPDVIWQLKTHDVIFNIPGSGKLEIFVVLDDPPVSEKGRAQLNLGPEKIWSGRAVSSPAVLAGRGSDADGKAPAWRDAESQALVGLTGAQVREKIGKADTHANAEPPEMFSDKADWLQNAPKSPWGVVGHFYEKLRPGQVLVVRERTGEDVVFDACWAVAGEENQAFLNPPARWPVLPKASRHVRKQPGGTAPVASDAAAEAEERARRETAERDAMMRAAAKAAALKAAAEAQKQAAMEAQQRQAAGQ